jgi:hypothetical protein
MANKSIQKQTPSAFSNDFSSDFHGIWFSPGVVASLGFPRPITCTPCTTPTMFGMIQTCPRSLARDPWHAGIGWSLVRARLSGPSLPQTHLVPRFKLGLWKVNPFLACTIGNYSKSQPESYWIIFHNP